MKKKDLISILDLDKKEILKLLNLTYQIKLKLKKGIKYTPLTGKTLALIFQRPSTRTRVSFEVGMHQLGGYAIFLSGKDMQIRRGETMADTAKTLSRYVNGIVIRAKKHNDIIELSKFSSIPVINGLSDLEHPCQALSDIYTIVEELKIYKNIEDIKKIKFVYIGDGNNIANSLLLIASVLGMNFTICVPKNYEPSEEILNKAYYISKETKANIILLHNPEKSVIDADFLYTDVWTSMGEEKEHNLRKKIFHNYQVNKKLLSNAKENVKIMHCLPAHRGEEITDDVIDSPNSIVFNQTENRLHTQKAILTYLLKI